LKRSALPHVVVGALGAQSRMVLCLQAETRNVFGGRRGGRWAWWAPRSARGMVHVTSRIRRGGSSGNGAVRVVALPVWSARVWVPGGCAMQVAMWHRGLGRFGRITESSGGLSAICQPDGASRAAAAPAHHPCSTLCLVVGSMPPLCPDACVFAKDGRGGRARVRGSHGLCVFCDPDRLAGALRLLASRRSVFGVLRSWRCVGSPVYDFAWRASALVTLPADDLRALRSEVEGGPSFLCRGLRFDGAPLSPCQFARDGEGGRARVHGADACVFCDVAAVKAALNAPLSRRAVVAALRGWFARGSDTYDFAWVASSLSFLPDVVVRSLRAEVEDGFCDGLRCGELLLAPCQFAPDGRGGRARSRGARACIFCDAAAMEAALGAGTSRWRVVCVLRHWMRSELPSYAAAWVGSALAFLSDDDQEQLRAEVTHTHGAAKRAAALADSARRVSRRRCSTAAAASSGRPSGSAMVARGNAQQTLEAWVRDAEPLALDAQRRAVMARPGTFRACRVCGTPRWVPNFAPGRLRCWMPQAALPPGALPYAQ